MPEHSHTPHALLLRMRKLFHHSPSPKLLPFADVDYSIDSPLVMAACACKFLEQTPPPTDGELRAFARGFVIRGRDNAVQQHWKRRGTSEPPVYPELAQYLYLANHLLERIAEMRDMPENHSRQGGLDALFAWCTRGAICLEIHRRH
jgi:hypothetical protein